MSKPKLTPEQARAEWVKALRQGGYRQTTEKLCEPVESRSVDQEYAYCCLGVGCEIHRQFEDGPDWTRDGNDREAYMGEEGVLPDQVVAWLGLSDDQGLLVERQCIGNRSLTFARLIDANDGGATFAQIANWIEQGKVALEDG